MLAKLPARLCSISGDVATMLTEASRREPSKRKLALIRLGVLAAYVVFSPLIVVLALRGRRSTAYDALYKQVRETWRTSASDAMALLRSTYQQLVARGAFSTMKRVEISPFGVFATSDALSVYRFLYLCEVHLGNFEEGLAISATLPGRLDTSILEQVDCLVALDRKADAIALLEGNLDVDGWRGKLRRRLRELGGRHLRPLD